MIELTLFKYQFQILRFGKGQWLTPVLLYILICSLFPLTVAVGTDLQPYAVGIIWVGLLLASIQAMATLFRHEYDSGLLEQLILSEVPIWRWALVKTLAQCLFTLFPILIIMPFIMLLLGLSLEWLPLMLLTLSIGTFGIYFIGAIGAALVVSLPSAGMLLALIILPFYFPILIFAVGAVTHAMLGIDSNALLWLGCCSLLALTLAPFATAACLQLQT